MTSRPVWSTALRSRAALAALAAAFALAVAITPPAAGAATYGEAFGLAAPQGALPGPSAFWAGTCDLSSAATGYEAGPPPAEPRDCIDTATSNVEPLSAEAFSPPPAWRLAADSQAGAHPDATAIFALARDTADLSGSVTTLPFPAGATRDVEVQLPPGLVGDPGAVPKCTNAQFQAVPPGCPAASQVGVTELRLRSQSAIFSLTSDLLPVYDLEPLPGHTAEFGIPYAAGFTPIRILASARTDGDFGVDTGVERIPTGIPLLQQSLTFWGVPWAAAHQRWRLRTGTDLLTAGNNEGMPQSGLQAADQAPYEAAWGPIEPFLSAPTACTGVAPVTRIWADSWQDQAATLTDGEPDPADPAWVRAVSEAPPVSGCTALDSHFDPGFSFAPKSHLADSPSAFDADLSLPQNDEPPAGVAGDPSASGAPAYWGSEAGLATAHLKDTTVTLPPGVTVNPAAAAGLAACSEEQVGLLTVSGAAPAPIRFDDQPVACPDGSKIGTVEVETPLLEEALEGSVYLAAQEANPFGSLLALYLVVEDPERGLTIKLAGKAEPDPLSGRVTATFTDNPQLPFTHLRLHLAGGGAAPLATPPTCGRFTTQATLTPWSGTAAVSASDGFGVDQAPGGGCPTDAAAQPFGLGFQAGTASPTAGATSPFSFRLTRPDGAQTIDRVELTTPPGLSAYLAGVPYCPETGIAQAEARSEPGDGRLEEASPSCPAASRIGTATIGAGAGPDPFYVSGEVYLSGPYGGAPLSLVVVVPALAGPFDLGVQVVRTALAVDPTTAQITARSDAIPTILQGIPLRIRDIRVDLDRSGFTLNPTSCEPLAVGGQVHGSGGAVANLSGRFQVRGCPALAFHPKLRFRLEGGTRRHAFPALKAVLTQRPGQAGIRYASVLLPHSEFLEQGHIGTVCTRVQFDAVPRACPARSVYGKAKAWSPLLEAPLEGPVYLRSNGGERKLPDLVAALRGPASQPIEVDLLGYIGSRHARIRNTFALLPDVPVSRFVLEMDGGRKGLLTNSEDLCGAGRKRRAAIVRLLGQNDRRADQFPVVRARCHKKVARRH
jgi:hypothetical protein